jgi:hypothetical protein
MFENVFNQPYAYHAGFADQGFLYNEEGNCTLIWSVFDPDFVAIVGQKNPWALSSADHKKLEDLLQLAPDGTRWLFDNPARCIKCGHAISGPITDTIYYLEYHGSVELDGPGLKKVLKKPV